MCHKKDVHDPYETCMTHVPRAIWRLNHAPLHRPGCSVAHLDIRRLHGLWTSGRSWTASLPLKSYWVPPQKKHRLPTTFFRDHVKNFGTAINDVRSLGLLSQSHLFWWPNFLSKVLGSVTKGMAPCSLKALQWWSLGKPGETRMETFQAISSSHHPRGFLPIEQWSS